MEPKGKNTMASTSYFFNQYSGVNMMIAVFFSIAIHSFLANVSVVTPLHITRAIIILSNIYIIITWIIVLIGRSEESYNTIKLALIFWSVYICLWIVAVTFSVITTAGEKYMCSQRRCPESMWLFNNTWHNDWLLLIKDDYELDANYIIKPVTKHTTEFDDYNSIHKANIKLPNINDIYYGNYKNIEENIDQSVKINVNQSEKSNKHKKHEEHDKQKLQTSTIEFKNDILFPDYEMKNEPIIQTIPKYVFKVSILFIILVISIMFGILTFGWFVLFFHMMTLKHQIKRGCL